MCALKKTLIIAVQAYVCTHAHACLFFCHVILKFILYSQGEGWGHMLALTNQGQVFSFGWNQQVRFLAYVHEQIPLRTHTHA